MIRNNSVILNGFIAGLYNDQELEEMLDKLAKYYKVDKSEFHVTKDNPFESGILY